MQILQDNYFEHSNFRFGADGGLEAERQLLVEEQKLCRVRARKFSLETNRRRKVLEDKRKLLEVQEQRLRENILQQRRQRVQDATERFQRAHLPPSQRHRVSIRRNALNMEDALNQIQGTCSSHSQQSFYLSDNHKIKSTSSPKPPAISKSLHRQALSAVEAYAKVLQDQCATRFNSQETGNAQANQQNRSPQDIRVSDSQNSESLSSQDSLENDDPNHSTNKNPQNSFPPFLLESEPQPVLRKRNAFYPESDLTFSAVMLLGNKLLQSKHIHESKQKKHEDQGGPKNTVFASEPETPEEPKCNMLTFCKIMKPECNSPHTSPDDNIDASPNSHCPKQDAVLRVPDDKQLKHPSATEILLPAKYCNNKDVLPKFFLNDSTTYNASQEAALQQTGKENTCLPSQKELSASINNLNKILNSECKTEKPISAALLQHSCLSNIQSDSLHRLQCPEEEAQDSPGSHTSVCEVRFIKGILKKHSMRVPQDSTCMYGSGHFIFAKQVALKIKDSVELARAKAENAEADRTIKKKLRWFDEVHVATDDKEQSVIKQMKGKSSSLCQLKGHSEDHQPSLTTVSGAYKPGPPMTPAASTGYHFTKQAWADVGVQVSLPQEQEDEVKVLRSGTRTGGPRAPQRERSSKVGVASVSTRTRKGTVMRPQSATEVSRIAKTQGKLMVPRPPPRVEEKMVHTAKAPYGPDHGGVGWKQALGLEQKNDSECFLSPATHHRTGVKTFPVSEDNAKGTSSSGHQETHKGGRRRGMFFSDKGLCLDCTPTDDEITQVWHSVRSALATTDAKDLLSRQALENGRVGRKLFVEQSRHPGSGNRRLPQSSQPAKQAAEPLRQVSTPHDTGFPDDGFHLQMAEVHAEGLREKRDFVAATEAAQAQRPRTVQPFSPQRGPTSISLEEQKILLSLDRLNHQLHYVQEHVCAKSGTCDVVLADAPSTKKVKVTSHQKHRASSANHCSGYQRNNQV